jgi:hypothetical protein
MPGGDSRLSKNHYQDRSKGETSDMSRRGWSYSRHLYGLGSDENTGEAIELAKYPSSSARNSEQGWQGTSAQTFEALLEKAVQKLNVSRYKDANALEKDVYKIYTQNDKQSGFSNKDKGYREILYDCFKKTFRQNEVLEGIMKCIDKGGYVHVMPAVKEQINENKGRYSLNIHPDRIPDVIPRIIQEIATLPYVYEVKVASNENLANIKLDNVIVFFRNPDDGENKHELEQRLRSYGEATRPGHPAMMEPIEGNEGIAFADQNNAFMGFGWGKTRTRHIADVMFELREEEIDFWKLLPRIKKRFRENNIDSDNPYRDLPKEQETQHGREG